MRGDDNGTAADSHRGAQCLRDRCEAGEELSRGGLPGESPGALRTYTAVKPQRGALSPYARSWCRTPVTPCSMTSIGPATGKAATGTPQASASIIGEPEGVGETRKYQHITAGEQHRKLIPEAVAGEAGLREARGERGPFRAVADQELGSGDRLRQEGLEVLLYGEPAQYARRVAAARQAARVARCAGGICVSRRPGARGAGGRSRAPRAASRACGC